MLIVVQTVEDCLEVLEEADGWLWNDPITVGHKEETCDCGICESWRLVNKAAALMKVMVEARRPT